MIEFNQVSKKYARDVVALRDITLTVNKGDLIFLAGPSGAGKTTLLNLIAAIERPSSGTLTVSGANVGKLKSSGLPYLRRNLGLILQQQKLLQDRTVLANVMLPLLVTGALRSEAEKRAKAALDKVGLLEKAATDPKALSGGEQQRVSIARAIVNRPQIILADEPTANLDRDNANKVLDALRSFHAAGVTCLISTHDEQFLNSANRVVFLDQGQIVDHWQNSAVRSNSSGGAA
ncbi:cell division ATP-binding protein FtsE [Collimonas sp.]|jgi:cell division transport system ATP-binding protein|uniref:cell division ATP-binding protein FtsE n=1 Tax=Collimonas sp. TaxID=1963772 RepID=UPI002C77155E|nr:ATP-binding cassette domain-containing protein [Collimonas sp.]HWW06087.1 ATP-binding cassette domain-containing protein [Collimonas sp.]